MKIISLIIILGGIYYLYHSYTNFYSSTDYEKYLKKIKKDGNFGDNLVYDTFKELHKYEKYSKQSYYKALVTMKLFLKKYRYVKDKINKDNGEILELKTYKNIIIANLEAFYLVIDAKEFIKFDKLMKKIDTILLSYIDGMYTNKLDSIQYPQPANIIKTHSMFI